MFGLVVGVCGAEKVVREVDPGLFIKENLVGEVVKEERVVSDGSKVMCWVIKVKSEPHEHEVRPFSPKHVDDGKDKGEIWMKDGKVYDVDGALVKNLAMFHDDQGWNLVNEDGSIRVTKTQKDFEAAARPDVGPEYKNFSVEGDLAWYPDVVTACVIPVKPVYQEKVSTNRRRPVGVAFNGVRFDGPAPLDAITGAYTIALLDDGGGHLNPHAGYHYHAVTGKTKEVAQADGHAPMIGYAMDGFALYAHLDADGEKAEGLDVCGGYYDDVRGYHYHVGAAGSNEILKSFRGVTGSVAVERTKAEERGGRGGPLRGGRPDHGPPPHEHGE